MRPHAQVLAVVLLACSTVTASGFDGSGAPWGARDPQACVPFLQDAAPDAEAAKARVRCNHEVAYDASGELWLMEPLEIAVGPGVPFIDMYFTYAMENADVSRMVYPLSGSFTRSVCITRKDAALSGDPDLNCSETDVPKAGGVCWQTESPGWKCLLTGASGETRKPTRPPQ